MAEIIIHNVDEEVKREIELNAARKGHSLQDELLEILKMAAGIGIEPQQRNIANSIRARFAAIGGVDLELPPRTVMDKKTRV